MPRGMLPNEDLVDSAGKRSGVKYIAANGSKMENFGEKKVRFKQAAPRGITKQWKNPTLCGPLS